MTRAASAEALSIFTNLTMADSEYTDDETEYDSPSNSQAVLLVRLPRLAFRDSFN